MLSLLAYTVSFTDLNVGSSVLLFVLVLLLLLLFVVVLSLLEAFSLTVTVTESLTSFFPDESLTVPEIETVYVPAFDVFNE